MAQASTRYPKLQLAAARRYNGANDLEASSQKILTPIRKYCTITATHE